MKKELKILIALAAVSLVLGGLAFASSQYSVKALTDDINAIGKVSYSEESRRLIDAADDRLAKPDPNLHLDQRAENIDALKSAKVTYVEQAIIRLYRSIRDHHGEDEIREYLADAEEAFTRYLTPGDVPLIHNFKDLTDARKKYGEPEESGTRDFDPGVTVKETPIELC